MAPEYGDTPPWHDVMAAITGPAVYDVETVFRERWEDPTRLTRHPVYWTQDKLLRMDMTPDPLPEQAPPPPPAGGGRTSCSCCAPTPTCGGAATTRSPAGGERSVARGYTQGASSRRGSLIYVEDQYLWGQHVGDVVHRGAARPTPTCTWSRWSRCSPTRTGSGPDRLSCSAARRAMRADDATRRRTGWRSTGSRTTQGTPVYVHAKVCVIDDTWATVGSDNFNRRSWTHDSELSAVVVDARVRPRLRLTLAAEHLDRLGDGGSQEDALAIMSDCVDPLAMYDAYAASAKALDDWHTNGRVGPRPPGHLRSLPRPAVGAVEAKALTGVLDRLHDPDGRPAPLQRRNDY